MLVKTYFLYYKHLSLHKMKCKRYIYVYVYIYYKKKMIKIIIITISSMLYNLQNKEKKKLENLVNISQLLK